MTQTVGPRVQSTRAPAAPTFLLVGRERANIGMEKLATYN